MHFSMFGLALMLAAQTWAYPTLEPCFCPLNLRPVCGNDGNVYPNKCALACEQRTKPELELRNSGDCEALIQSQYTPCMCPNEYKPVCGTDGRTYPSACALRCGRRAAPRVELLSQGPCVSTPQDVAQHDSN